MKSEPSNAAVALALAVALGASSLLSAKAAGPEKMVDDVLLDHIDSRILGKCRLYLSNQGGRFETVDGRVVAVCRPPTWEMKLYAPKSKVVYSMANAKLKANGLGVFTAPVDYSQARVSPDYNALLRVKTLKVSVDVRKQAMVVNDAYIFQTRTKRVLLDSVLRVAQGYKINPFLQSFVDFLFNQSIYQGLPIELKNTYQGGVVETLYSTSSVEYVKRPAAIFDFPIGMKPVTDKIQVLMSEDTKTTLEDLLGSPDVDSKKAPAAAPHQ
jgi:hypothetical protein